jgi:hypothetical protein
MRIPTGFHVDIFAVLPDVLTYDRSSGKQIGDEGYLK